MNREISLYERNKGLWWSVGSAILIQGIIILVLALNMINRRKAERALRVSEQRLSLALESGSDGYWDLDVPSHTLLFSPFRGINLGVTRQEKLAQI